MNSKPNKLLQHPLSRFGDGLDDEQFEDEPDPFLRPVWEDNDAADDLLPSVFTSNPLDYRPSSRSEPMRLHADLANLLAETSAILGRLEMYMELVPAFLRKGLIRRFCYLEASGWFGYQHQKIDPIVLAVYGMKLNDSTQKLLTQQCNASEDQHHHTQNIWEGVRGHGFLQTAANLAVALENFATMRHNAFRRDPAGALGKLLFVSGAGTMPANAEHIEPRDWLNIPLLDAAVVAGSAMNNAGTADNRSLYGSLLGHHYARLMGVLRQSPLPYWVLQATLAQPMIDDELPKLRPDIRAKLGVSPDAPSGQVCWLMAVREGASMFLREAKRLHVIWQHFEPWMAAEDRRSFLPNALKLTIENYVISSQTLAQKGKVSELTAARAHGRLLDLGFISEVTGRNSWRAYAVRGSERPSRFGVTTPEH